MDVVDVAKSLREEAIAADERRVLVLSGERERGYDALVSILEALPVPITTTTLVGPDDRLRCEHVPQSNATQLLGTTHDVVILDAHQRLRPNALGSVVGTVDGGGLLVLLTPSLAEWPDRRDEFDESLAVPPFSVGDVTGHFRRRLVDTLKAHRGVAIVDLETDTVESDGLTRPAPRSSRRAERPAVGFGTEAESEFQFQFQFESEPVPGPGSESNGTITRTFPSAAYESCYTQDQADALAALESLLDPGRAVVCEADRGRGKSSALGLAAGCLAARGEDVLVTAPAYRNAAEVLERASEVLETLEVPVTWEQEGGGSQTLVVDTGTRAANGSLDSDGRGCIRFLESTEAPAAVEGAGVVLVDEAAALPVRTLTELLAAERIAFATTVHGYEGAGRGFSVRFRDRLEESDHEVTDVTLVEPIRYASGDPIEVWAFHALGLDARPAVDPVVADADPESVAYRRLSSPDLLADEHLLREAFGLLVLAHYRTEPDDLARVLDAPNLEARALCHDGHVVSVCLLAREGNLPSDVRAEMYEGGRVRGNMLPDVLISQLRDEDAGRPGGLRVMRIATHHAVRSRGLGSRLLECVREEFSDGDTDRNATTATGTGELDWLGTGFGATPALLSFWHDNGYSAIHCSTTRNDTSGEYSAIMLAPLSDGGQRLHDRHAERFVRRIPAVCSDALDDLEPDVARALLRSVDIDPPPLELTPHEWRIVAGAAYGPGLFDVDPGPFRELVVRYFVTTAGPAAGLTEREERLLVLRALQGREWQTVADRLAYHSAGQCMRAFGDALQPLVDRFGDETALAVRERFSDSVSAHDVDSDSA